MSLPDFNDVTLLLEKANSMMDASEAHGLICGFLCGGKQTNGKNWLEPLLGFADLRPSEAIRQILVELYNASYAQLNSENFDFYLLTPNDNQALDMRAKALSSWCQGFLTGVGLTGAYIDEEDTEETQEVLYRFDDIAKLDYDSIEVRPEDEKAFLELHEYVRLAVLVVYNELPGASSIGPDTTNKHLH